MSKVLLLCMEVLGKSMAGPAIRYWEFANALSKKHEVTLMSPNVTDLTSNHFNLKPHYHQLPKNEVKHSDVVITQTINYKLAIAAKHSGAKLILDAYDPEPLEHLEIFRDKPLPERVWDIHNISTSCSFAMSMADAVICANEQQKDLWTGLLMAQGRLTPQLYDQDCNIRQLIDTVPFGLPSVPPKRTGVGLRTRFNIKAEDHVLLWGGGIWNWFDPLTLIRAINLLSQKRKDIHLVFMGIKHPNPIIPQMKMARDAIDLAKTYGLIDKNVFVNYGWLPYEERQNYLLDATLGVSNHFDNLETRYAFRTRILDYIWAELPIITTEGDSFAELVKAQNLGSVVPYNDPQSLANAIEALIDNPALMQEMKQNISKLRTSFQWENTTLPLLKMINNFQKLPKNSLTFKDMVKVAKFLGKKVVLKMTRKPR